LQDVHAKKKKKMCELFVFSLGKARHFSFECMFKTATADQNPVQSNKIEQTT